MCQDCMNNFIGNTPLAKDGKTVHGVLFKGGVNFPVEIMQ